MIFMIFIEYQESGVEMLKTWHLSKARLAAPIGTFARFQAGFLSSEDFHVFVSSIFIDFPDFHDFHRFHIFGYILVVFKIFWFFIDLHDFHRFS